MARKKPSEFAKIRKARRIGAVQAAELFQVTPRTIRNWDERGAPPLAMRLLWETEGRLDSLHPRWAGFKIGSNGKLYGPNKLRISPEHLAHWRELLRCPSCGRRVREGFEEPEG